MNWFELILAVMAGGFLSSVLQPFIDSLAAARERRQWLREQRLQVFWQLLDLVSITAPRDDYESWPSEIRRQCQRALLLFPGGAAPREVSEVMERLFQAARARKKNAVADHDQWTESMRNDTRILRTFLSNTLAETDRGRLARLFRRSKTL